MSHYVCGTTFATYGYKLQKYGIVHQGSKRDTKFRDGNKIKTFIEEYIQQL